MYTSIQFKMEFFHHFAVLLHVQHDVLSKANNFVKHCSQHSVGEKSQCSFKCCEKKSAHMQVQNYLIYNGCP